MDAASIEQMNKVRVSLGMAPLPVPGKDQGPQFKEAEASGDSGSESEEASTVEKRQAAAGSNWQKLEAERKEKAERQKRKDAAKRSRDAAQRFAKLEGKGLGDADDNEGEVDTRTWLLQQKKRQKKIEKARKMEEELAAREQQAEYTSKDLAGVKVGHSAGDFEDAANEQVLTLKDREIGEESDEDEDELENAELRAKEFLEKRLESKKKRPDYDPTEMGEARNVLSKYDEEIEGKKRRNFTIDAKGSTAEPVGKAALDAGGEFKSKGIKINLDMLKDDAPVSDYVDLSTVKMKKPKKKKEKKTRQKAADEDDIVPPSVLVPAEKDADAMDVDAGQANGLTSNKKRSFEFDDDDDLQAKLAEQRRQALKKRKKTDAAELARQMREEMPIEEEVAEEGGMTLDETTEFVANLKKPEAPELKAPRSRSPNPATADSPEAAEDGDGDTAMVESYAEIDDEAPKERPREAPRTGPEITATGLEEEQSMAGEGLGASLAMLRKRGLMSTADDKLAERERQRNQFLADKQHLIEDFDRRARQQREEERRKGTWERMSHRDREQFAQRQNEARERYLNQLLDESYKKHYRPTVELKYTDEFGRDMNQKEAFKHMSHMFHGKGSGKGKTEKRLKKIEDEDKERRKGVLSLEGEGGMREVQGREGKRTKMAGVRLQ